MTRLQRVGFVGNYLPRRCGIATFTHDLQNAVAAARPAMATCVVAMSDVGGNYAYPERVRFQVRDNMVQDYKRAAAFLNSWGADVVSLQHEYGIFGGEAGKNIVALMHDLRAPIVTTLHTVLVNPNPSQYSVMADVIASSAKVVVMSEKGRALLTANHNISPDKVEIIAHGIPDVSFTEPNEVKRLFGFAGKTVILTFGLLSPSKGLETVIDAMPEIVAACPTAIYVVLGATHPNLVREQGEAYREALVARAKALGLENHVVFFNEFVDQAKLLQFIAMCDVYVTPYLNEEQMTSGTLAYSFGLGKAVVSTPYWHAKELLADGRGILVPFGDSRAIGHEIKNLLGDDVRRREICRRAYAVSRSMIWPETARAYLATFESTRGVATKAITPPPPKSSIIAAIGFVPPQIHTDQLLAMCDSTGILQHAVYSIPDRLHGYCIDDNARALLLGVELLAEGEHALPDALITSFAAFIQHAWNPDEQRFRNFMSYDRRWLEPRGSEDSHGRTLWALAECAAKDRSIPRRAWAKALFQTALPAARKFTSPRAWAFALLALDAHCSIDVVDGVATKLRIDLANRLLTLLNANERTGWHWFENVLAYDNARLPQALIVTGINSGTPRFTTAGLATLRWLMERQTAKEGHFRPIGSDSFGKCHQEPSHFDQQPIEAAATIDACIAASAVDKTSDWRAQALIAFQWFTGSNDLRVSLIDPVSGGCLDGLHQDRANRNMGAESILAYLMSVVSVRQALRSQVAPARACITPIHVAIA